MPVEKSSFSLFISTFISTATATAESQILRIKKQVIY
jgi:hypothetical protein